MKQGTRFHRIHFPENPITIKEIITHKKESGNRKVKLDRPLYVMEYDRWVSKEKRELTEVNMYAEDIKAQIEYQLWNLQIAKEK